MCLEPVLVGRRRGLLQQIGELVDGQASLVNDGAQRAAREVSALVRRDRGLPGRVRVVHQAIVAAAGTDDRKPGALQCSKDVARLEGRQSPSALAATETLTE